MDQILLPHRYYQSFHLCPRQYSSFLKLSLKQLPRESVPPSGYHPQESTPGLKESDSTTEPSIYSLLMLFTLSLDNIVPGLESVASCSGNLNSTLFSIAAWPSLWPWLQKAAPAQWSEAAAALLSLAVYLTSLLWPGRFEEMNEAWVHHWHCAHTREERHVVGLRVDPHGLQRWAHRSLQL